MNRVVMFVLFILVLTGCKTKDLRIVKDYQTEEYTNVKDTAAVETNRTTDLNELLKNNTEVIVEETIYDTEKPVDSITKTPPISIKRKTTYIDTSTRDTKVKDTSVSTSTVNKSTSTTSSSVAKEDIKETLNKKSPLKYASSILWAVVVLVGIFIGYKLYRKFI